MGRNRVRGQPGSGIPGVLQFGETRYSWATPSLVADGAGFVGFDTDPSDLNLNLNLNLTVHPEDFPLFARHDTMKPPRRLEVERSL